MELWLQILIGILVVVAILAIVFLIATLRRINIVFKKVDYITEDLTYKLESLSSTVDTLKAFSKYFNLVQNLLNDKDLENNPHLKENKKQILALSDHLKKVAEKINQSQNEKK